MKSIRELIEQAARHRLERKTAEAGREARRRINVREYGGELYICHDGKPVVAESSLDCPIVQALDAARKAYTNLTVAP